MLSLRELDSMAASILVLQLLHFLRSNLIPLVVKILLTAPPIHCLLFLIAALLTGFVSVYYLCLAGSSIGSCFHSLLGSLSFSFNVFLTVLLWLRYIHFTSFVECPLGHV